MPGLILQLTGAGLLAVSPVAGWLKVVNAICLVGSLGPTFLVSAPLHGRLSTGKKDEEIERLIRTNLPRTWLWTAHLLVAIFWWLLTR